MLVIRRRAGESVFIGEEAEIEILEVTGSQVKLGIRAPKHITVLRKEVLHTQQANLAAARPISSTTLENVLEQLRR
jgi:carbon storage regulator